jgi:hypothetical protein
MLMPTYEVKHVLDALAGVALKLAQQPHSRHALHATAVCETGIDDRWSNREAQKLQEG